MPQYKKIFPAVFAVLCMISMLIFSVYQPSTVHAASGYEFVILNKYSKSLNIGDKFQLIAVTSNGKKPSFSSSSSSVASVNTYGKVTAKKAGTATITVKIRNGEARCKITVQKTKIEVSARKISLENGCSAKLNVTVSTGHPATFKSSKKSVASVDENGVITAKKPGTATITATADRTSAACQVTVRQPTLKLSKSSVSLFRKGVVKLSVSSTSKSTPKWKTNKKSVATVDQKGTVTAVKHGTATITVTVDGCSKTCEVTVKKPQICFAKDSVTLTVGETAPANVSVSSKNKPEFSSSNSHVASVSENGRITARAKGRAYIYAKEDGAKERMTVTVKEK